MSTEPDRESVIREHARQLVSSGKPDDEIGHTIVVSYDAVDRHLVWNYVFQFRAEAEQRTGLVETALPQAATKARKPGRPPLTEGRVRGDIEFALSDLQVKGESVTWDLLAGAHPGELSRSGLDYRYRKFPQPFRDLVRHLIRE